MDRLGPPGRPPPGFRTSPDRRRPCPSSGSPPASARTGTSSTTARPGRPTEPLTVDGWPTEATNTGEDRHPPPAAPSRSTRGHEQASRPRASTRRASPAPSTAGVGAVAPVMGGSRPRTSMERTSRGADRPPGPGHERPRTTSAARRAAPGPSRRRPGRLFGAASPSVARPGRPTAPDRRGHGPPREPLGDEGAPGDVVGRFEGPTLRSSRPWAWRTSGRASGRHGTRRRQPGAQLHVLTAERCRPRAAGRSRPPPRARRARPPGSRPAPRRPRRPARGEVAERPVPPATPRGPGPRRRRGSARRSSRRAARRRRRRPPPDAGREQAVVVGEDDDSARAAAIPRLRARPRPGTGSLTTRRGTVPSREPPQRRPVWSVEPLSTTTSSKDGGSSWGHASQQPLEVGPPGPVCRRRARPW